MTVGSPPDLRARRPWRRRVAAGTVALVTLAMVVLALLETAAPARLTAVTPADGSALATAPVEVSLTFTGAVRARQMHVGVSGVDGALVGGAPRIDGTRVVLPVAIGRPGTYLVGYHLVLDDGRELSGSSRFTVASSGPIGVVPTPEQAAAGAEPAGAEPAGHVHGGRDPWSIPLLCLDFLLIVALAVLLFRRPRPRGPAA
jgi:methionine-rich copper-binding protein CopC